MGLPNVSYSTQVIRLIASPKRSLESMKNNLFDLPANRASRHASIKSDFISGFSFPIDSPR
jgi:hypothetical protein